MNLINYKHTLLLILLFASNNLIFAQIEAPISNPKRIEFTYSSKPNFIFADNGFYADSTFFKIEFPRMKYILKKSPQDSLKTLGFILKSKLYDVDLKKIKSIVWHTFVETKFTYYTKYKEMDSEGSFCKTKECQSILKDFFNEKSLNGVDFSPSTLRFYDDKKRAVQMVKLKPKEIDYSKNLITWTSDNNNIGTYTVTKNDYKIANVVIFNPWLDMHINPNQLFGNSKFGVEKVYSLLTTTTLTMVKYK